jgi:hypothetical protein
MLGPQLVQFMSWQVTAIVYEWKTKWEQPCFNKHATQVSLVFIPDLPAVGSSLYTSVKGI